MTHPPPRSTLFPYTTLFRSLRGLLRQRLGRARFDVFTVTDVSRRIARLARVRRRHARSPGRARRRVRRSHLGRKEHAVAGRDRKSTRLNSSHGYISYAVFCLNDTPTTQIYTLSLHDALPISSRTSPSAPRARSVRRFHSHRCIAADRSTGSGSTTARALSRPSSAPRPPIASWAKRARCRRTRSEEHTSELQSRLHLVCRLLLE